MSLEGNDPVIGHGGRVSLGRNQGGQPVKKLSALSKNDAVALNKQPTPGTSFGIELV